MAKIDIGSARKYRFKSGVYRNVKLAEVPTYHLKSLIKSGVFFTFSSRARDSIVAVLKDRESRGDFEEV